MHHDADFLIRNMTPWQETRWAAAKRLMRVHAPVDEIIEMLEEAVSDGR